MKKALLCIALFCAITGYISGDNAVDSTRSMSYTHLSAIKTAFSGGSDVASYYWNEFINDNPNTIDSLFDETERGDFELLNDLYKKYFVQPFPAREEYQDSLASKLDSHASWVYDRMVNTRPVDWEHALISNNLTSARCVFHLTPIEYNKYFV